VFFIATRSELTLFVITAYKAYKMAIDEVYLKHPEFKKKLWEVDDAVFNTPVDRNRAIPKDNVFVHKRYDHGIDCDEVFPNILVGNEAAAKNKLYLKNIGVTHVLNCAQGERQFMQVPTNENYYRDVNIKFKGLQLVDTWNEDISRTFEESALFIDEAIANGGKVLIHCFVGVSRSATIAISYLILRLNFPVEHAVKTVKQNRPIRPNESFLRQLVQLHFKLRPNMLEN